MTATARRVRSDREQLLSAPNTAPPTSLLQTTAKTEGAAEALINFQGQVIKRQQEHIRTLQEREKYYATALNKSETEKQEMGERISSLEVQQVDQEKRIKKLEISEKKNSRNLTIITIVQVVVIVIGIILLCI